MYNRLQNKWYAQSFQIVSKTAALCNDNNNLPILTYAIIWAIEFAAIKIE